MNAKQKLHQSNLERWALLIQAQAESGLTVKAWCEENGVSFNAYNYWKHLLKEEYFDSCMPDIVQITADPSLPNQSSQMTSCESRDSRNSRDPYNSCNSRDSRELYRSYNSRHSYEPQPIRICTADVDISISPMAGQDLILRILKAVRYA